LIDSRGACAKRRPPSGTTTAVEQGIPHPTRGGILMPLLRRLKQKWPEKPAFIASMGRKSHDWAASSLVRREKDPLG
jgi:hypothetical protein